METTPRYASGTVRSLLDSDLVTPATREVLRVRLNAVNGPPYSPRFFDAHAFATLRSACDRLIPQPEHEPHIDLAAEIDRRLAEGKGDGWRYDDMPPDGQVFRRGLRGLDDSAHVQFGSPFAALNELQQDLLLHAVQRGDVGGDVWQSLPAKRFFEDLLAEATEIYYSHPLAQEEIGYVGMADAHGWQAVGLNELDAHEPHELGNR